MVEQFRLETRLQLDRAAEINLIYCNYCIFGFNKFCRLHALIFDKFSIVYAFKLNA